MPALTAAQVTTNHDNLWTDHMAAVTQTHSDSYQQHLDTVNTEIDNNGYFYEIEDGALTVVVRDDEGILRYNREHLCTATLANRMLEEMHEHYEAFDEYE